MTPFSTGEGKITEIIETAAPQKFKRCSYNFLSAYSSTDKQCCSKPLHSRHQTHTYYAYNLQIRYNHTHHEGTAPFIFVISQNTKVAQQSCIYYNLMKEICQGRVLEIKFVYCRHLYKSDFRTVGGLLLFHRDEP